MVSDELGKQLHDRATRGKSLSTEEQAQLEAWYAVQDRVEMEELGMNATTKTAASLQIQIDAVLSQLTTVTQRIQKITEENEALRREIATLQRQLAQRTSPQSA
jgi:peptidoglycan hydrolase CwlO-like protein